MRKLLRRLRRFPSPFPLLFIILGTIAVILYGRGYRPDFRENKLKTTGLLSATSDPIGAQVFLDGKLKTATNNPLNIDPGWYTVTISKESYIPWQKRLRVQGEVVTRADAFLFPTNPSLSPITTVGIEKPSLSPDGTKIAYIIPLGQSGVSSQKAGLWVYDLVERTLGFNRDPRQLGASSPTFNFSNATLTWSPDSTQILADIGKTLRLYQTSRSGDFQDVSATYQIILRDWEEARLLKERQKLASFKQEIVDVATSSARIIAFSPDETKILYEATASATLPLAINPPLIGTNSTEEERTILPRKLYVYDSREDKNFFLMEKNELPQPAEPSPSPSPQGKRQLQASPTSFAYNHKNQSIYWFPTNRHLVLTLPGKIDIMEYDRTNWVTIYSGPFIDGFMAPWPNGSRIIILTTLNPGVASLPNLYTVNLR